MRIGKLKLFEKRIIGNEQGDPLLVRWILIRHEGGFGIFLHKLCRSDYDRALHDHPWAFVSLVLKQGYDEVLPSGLLHHYAGEVMYRPAEWKHRVVIRDGKPAWTLIFMGPKRRHWGFWTDNKWCYWRKYDLALGICEEDTQNFGGDDD